MHNGAGDGVKGADGSRVPDPATSEWTTKENNRDHCGVETDFLIVGCGPAGASLACFLGSYGESSWQSLSFMASWLTMGQTQGWRGS